MSDSANLLPVLGRKMTADERRQFRQLAATVDTSIWDTLPKQEMLIDYIRARNDLAKVRVGFEQASEHAAKSPTDPEVVALLAKWMSMMAKVEGKIDRLRVMCGMTAKYEVQLNKAKQVKGAPKGGLEIKPWQNV